MATATRYDNCKLKWALIIAVVEFQFVQCEGLLAIYFFSNQKLEYTFVLVRLVNIWTPSLDFCANSN